MEIRKLYSLFLECGIICTDSRNVQPGSLFIGIQGEHFNGNAYASEALKKGAARAVIDDPDFFTGNRMILVDNSVTMLQQLANFHRQQLDAKIICITGSNGKTTTRELMHNVFAKKFRTFATRGNLNNHIGLPLSLLEVQYNHQVAIIEMGANHPGENRLLAAIAAPDYGIITNIGLDHLEGFGSIEGIKAANGELFEYLRDTGGLAFVNFDDSDVASLTKDLETVSYGNAGTTPIPAYAAVPVSGQPFIELEMQYEQGRKIAPWRVKSRLFGSFQFSNILCAVATGRYFGVPAADAAAAVASYEPKNNRMQLVKTGSNTILLDAYNANPTSMQLTLENFLNWNVPSKMVILGDMLEMGNYAAAEHEKIVNLLEQQSAKLEKILLVGPDFARHRREGFLYFENTALLQAWLKQHPPSEMHILIKGSRGWRLEQLEVL